MVRRMSVLTMAAALIVLVSGMATAAPSFLSTTGGILAPNDAMLAPGDFSANLHSIDLMNNPSVMGANVGVTENLELGIARFDPDSVTVDEETFLNGKYLVRGETIMSPSLVVGVVDATGDLDPGGDPGFYAVAGKNLTSIATNLAGEPVQPIRGYVGIGTGIYSGIFAGIDWTLNSRVKIIGEFINEINVKTTIAEESMFNAGVRFTLTDSLRGDIAIINGEDMGFGISYRKLGL